MSDPSPQVGTPLHGPGGLLGTPGLGSPRRTRKGRKWGMRLKAKQIVGNLYRGDTGKFQAGSAASATPKRGIVLSKQPTAHTRVPTTAKPKRGGGKGRAAAKPKKVGQTPEQKRLARVTEHAQNRQKVLSSMNIAPDGQSALGDLADGEQPRDPSAIGRGGLVEAGLVEQARDGSYRLSASGRAAMAAAASGDAGRTGAIISSARDRTTGRTERVSAAAERKRQAQAKRDAAAAKKPSGGGGGGGSKKPATTTPALTPRQQAADARRAQADARRQQAAADRQAKQQRVLNRLRRQAKAGIKLTTAQRNQLTDAGLADESSGMWRVKAETYGGVKRSKLADNIFAGPDRSFPIKTAQDVKDAVRSLGRTKHDKDAVKRGIIRRARAIGAMDALPEDWRTKSFVVFKDHAGQPRWVARTTTAYRDRDGEIISEQALDQDSQRMMATKQFGPLRYWHIGQPDPASLDAPWGPGLDIGDCDYSVVIGRTRIESGTFRSAAIAEKMAAAAPRHEMSPGFLYTPDQPDPDGVFSSIRTFERSPVPRRYARAANLFTGFAVKEQKMELAEMERRFRAMYRELGLTPEQGLELGQQLLTTEKDASEQKVAFKEAAPPEEITIGGVVYAVKAAAPAMDEGSPEEEAAESPEEEQAEMDAGEGDSGDVGDYIGDMSVDDFKAMLGALLAPVLKMQDMVKAMGDAHAELKGMYGGVAQKDDARSLEVVAIKSQIAQLAEKLAQIEGDQPAMIMPDEVAAALKSAGPAAPADPNAVDVPNDPNRPFAAIAARTMPALYKNTPDGGFAGWTPPQGS